MTQTASDAQESQPVFEVIPDSEEIPTTPIPRLNGDEGKAAEEGSEPPSKRRRISDTPANSKPKPISPPWKKFAAEVPSSFIAQDGKRKSTRTNHIPLELQPPSEKRQTRGALQKTYSTKEKKGTTNGARSAQSPVTNGTKKPPTTLPSSQVGGKSPSKLSGPTHRPHRKSMPAEHLSTPIPSQKKSTTLQEPRSAPVNARAAKSRRSARTSDVGHSEDAGRPQALKTEDTHISSPKIKLARIKFRIKPAELPLTHPGLILQRPPRHSALKEFLSSEATLPVEEGGLFTPEDLNEYTPDAIARDAQLLLRLEEAAAPGGLLSPSRCSIYQPVEQEQPPQQYARQDHFNRAAVEFRRLMLIEEKKHRSNAKRLAEACRDEWNRRQPKSQEQLEAEQKKIAQGLYKSLVRTLHTTWDNVRAEVNRRRLVEWQAQEKIRQSKRLNEAVDESTKKLEARRARRDSEEPTDNEDSEQSVSGDDDEIQPDQHSARSDSDGESNMSSSESEAEEDDTQLLDSIGDEQLSLEQLRQKYSSLPDIQDKEEKTEADNESVVEKAELESNQEVVNMTDAFDDSDESIDMDDDMGSSDEDRDSDDEEDSDEDDEDDENGSSLLGFLAPSDLKSLEIDQDSAIATPVIDEVEIDEEDEVSLIPNVADVEPVNPDTAEEVLKPMDIDSEFEKPITEALVTSPDRSSQPTPRTTETRPSEADSVSSVDPHQSSRQVTKSATPQPISTLKTPVPFLLRGTLREYQHYGLDWLAGLYANNTNGILADEMGLGKTIQTIALLAHLACEHEIWGPHLVIVPTSVMLNWEMEFKKFLPGFKILTYYGTQEERKRKRLGWKTEDAWNVCITSYQLVLRDQQVFKRRRWHYMILDEAHNIKNFQSQRWQAMLTFNTRARLLLTGTPLQNNLTELWSLLYFLMPSDGTNQGVDGFANLKEFQDWFKKPSEQILEHGRDQMDDEARAIISKLHKVLRPYLLRRLKADVEKQMPAKYEHVEFCRLSKRQRELYDGFLNREDTRGTLASGNYLSIINCLMQLRKVCNHPDLFVERAIMTSFPMEKSAIADFEIKDLLIRRRLLREEPMSKVSVEFLNLVPTKYENISDYTTTRVHQLSAQKALMDMREAQRARAQNSFTNLDPSTAKSNLIYLESAARWGRFEELQHCVYLNALRRQQKPVFGSRLLNLVDLGVNERPMRPRPRRRDQIMTWLEDTSPALREMVPTLAARSESLKSTIERFACVTPQVVARDMTSLVLTPKGVDTFQRADTTTERDPFHEARMRLSIQFPDKRLLQYDCGKLQTLAKLLQRLQAGGHRALIFTQMTKVLDILEQFLNIHGHKYLRLDGSTKVEQRQILTDRFNNDTRILAFILSSRSGGLGINLTGADTVIFYDLDWNPAMDKQCQDRCHRIGQTRDVHIYRLISEHTIEANILRKANQKRMLDDVVIQEGEFTTDYFNKTAVRDVLDQDTSLLDGDAAANAAMDRVLGGPDNTRDVSRVLAQAEDREDVIAARVAEREIVQTDAADFDENALTTSATPALPGTPLDGELNTAVEGNLGLEDPMEIDDEDELNAWGQKIESTDAYMLNFMAEQLKDTPVLLPVDKNRSKRGKDRHRSHRPR